MKLNFLGAVGSFVQVESFVFRFNGIFTCKFFHEPWRLEIQLSVLTAERGESVREGARETVPHCAASRPTCAAASGRRLPLPPSGSGRLEIRPILGPRPRQWHPTDVMPERLPPRCEFPV